jgi:hypothetical protein
MSQDRLARLHRLTIGAALRTTGTRKPRQFGHEEVAGKKSEMTDDEILEEYLNSISFAGPVRPWREVPETGKSEDEPDEGEEE